MLTLPLTSAATEAEPWIVRFVTNEQARLRLFCFPYAGGGSSAFRAWPDYLSPEIEVCAIQPPGRETRLHTPPITSMDSLLSDLGPAIIPYLDRPFVFFGHSMGALISFELARWLRRQHNMLLAHLLVSGCPAPQLPIAKFDPPLHQLPAPTLVEHLQKIEGIPASVLELPELLHFMLPMIRADFAVCETYQYEANQPLDCPITVLGGLRDPMTSRDSLLAWQTQTKHPLALYLFPGNHFFIQDMHWLVLQMISKVLNQTLDKVR